MSGFYVGVAKCGCERAWLIDDNETTEKEVADFARRQHQSNRTMKHVENLTLEPAVGCTEHQEKGDD